MAAAGLLANLVAIGLGERPRPRRPVEPRADFGGQRRIGAEDVGDQLIERDRRTWHWRVVVYRMARGTGISSRRDDARGRDVGDSPNARWRGAAHIALARHRYGASTPSSRTRDRGARRTSYARRIAFRECRHRDARLRPAWLRGVGRTTSLRRPVVAVPRRPRGSAAGRPR